MTPKIILCFILFITFKSFSQSIEFIDQPLQRPKNSVTLYHLNTPGDSSNFEYIGKLKVSYNPIKPEPEKLFKVFKQVVLGSGASFYREYNFVKADTFVTVYYKLYHTINGDIINKNELANNNKVFVFGEIEKKEPSDFKVNNIRVDMPHASYYKAEIPKNGKLKLNKGSLTGETRTYKWDLDNRAVFLSFSEFGVGPGQSSVGPGGGSITINTGRFFTVDPPFGLFLSSLFKQVNK